MCACYRSRNLNQRAIEFVRIEIALVSRINADSLSIPFSDQAGQAALASAVTHYATARVGNEVQWNMLGLFPTVHRGGCSKMRCKCPLGVHN